VKLAVTGDGALAIVRGQQVAVVDAGPAGRPITMDAVVAGGDEARSWLAHAPGQRLSLAEVTLRAPLAHPGKIIAAPVNYTDHMREMSEVLDINDLGVFLKAPSSVCGPGAVVRLPYHDRRFDQEGELAVVIGREARGIPAPRALEAVFGYTCLLDITMRGGEDRSLRKSFDTFTPLGPWIVTADEVGDPASLGLKCSVSGEVRQDASTRGMIWPVARLVAYTSSVMTLYPGDIIATGTPEGVGPLAGGDTIELEIDKIGTLTVSVAAAAGAASCPTKGAGRGPVPPPPPARKSAGRDRPGRDA
jgi:2-keto-4-pentenoate hydratase/2-oxohepta-3-ene-1,7-dioic acid hydratase in catechol pathway